MINEIEIARLEEQCRRLKTVHPDRCAVYVQKDNRYRGCPDITKSKYLVQFDSTYGMFLLSIKQHLPKLKSSVAIFTFINGVYIPPISETFAELFQKHAVRDSKNGEPLYLFVTYCGENTFGVLG
jgi:hypothetical protein